MSAPADVPVAPAPSGRAVRRWTRSRTRPRSTRGMGELLGDVYTALLAVAVTVAMVLSISARLGADLAGAPAVAGEGVSLAPGWLAVLAALAALAGLAGLTARLGPVALSGPESSWWLPLPGERRSLLRPAAVRWPAVAAAAGACVGAAVILVLAPRPDPAVALAAAVLGGAVAAALVLAIGLTEGSRRAHRWARRVADSALAAVPAAGVVLAVLAPPVPAVSSAVVLAAAVAVAVVCAIALLLDRRLVTFRDSVLRERGAVSGEALGAVLSLDTRALGRALTENTLRPVRRRSTSMAWLARVPPRWRAHASLVTADALVLARSPRHLVQLVATALLPVVALAVPQPRPVVTLLLLVLGAYVGALATADGARRAQVSPALDALLPLSQAQVRRLRLAVPTAAMAAWSLLVFAAVAWRYGGAGYWLVLGLLAAPVWAGAAVRAAYRPLPDFSGPLIHSPMGSLPPGLSTVIVKGPDVASLGAIPVLIALLVGAAAPALLVVQAALSAIVLAIVARPGRPAT
ncbi:DUF6297 family protein [Georgenia sp. SYP-B2076]|uniref:DUF6297 family protein n=1 Tax=Georgenia sp. SYP-B2076 TaxID=2495881 RepID=UPI0013DEF304|nr:DUF6297 family protein [Georgenia sp. SYP-B2076]